MNKKPIYLDYMATTPVDPKVVEVMLNYMGPDGHFGNPASKTHLYGQMAMRAIEEARAKVADLVQANPEEILFTSGATESNNLAILGSARFYKRKGQHLITLATEHKSVLDSFKQLEREGFEVTYLVPESNGLIRLSAILEVLRPETILLSVMHVNNEIGVIQDIAAIAQLLKDRGIVFHVDAAQSAGKLDINLRELPIDLMSFSAHKNYGPKGIGALFVRQRPRIRLEPISFGGGQEGGVRSGTQATHQIVGMGEAFALSKNLLKEEQGRILSLRQTLWNGIKNLPGIRLNGDNDKRIAGNLNFSFRGIDGEALITALGELAVSTTSACTSSSSEPSYVLTAIGVSNDLAKSTVRLSIGRFTTEEEIERSIQIINAAVSKLQISALV